MEDPFGLNNPQPFLDAAPTPMPAAPQASLVDEFAPQAPTYNDISSQVIIRALFHDSFGTFLFLKKICFLTGVGLMHADINGVQFQ